jgi:threonine dehydrogenase-like Zn-dependent dehydrogenase
VRALVVRPRKAGVRLENRPAPSPRNDELLVDVLEAGICGTDRDIVAGRYGTPPPGFSELILGHENLGRVAEVGSRAGTGWAVGDLVVATVRRGCGHCALCNGGRSDFCVTDDYTERGIRGRDGYFAERYAESADHLVRVPPALASVGVLLEPMSVVTKAVEEGERLLLRLGPAPGEIPSRPWRALVTGTGAIGVLAALTLRAQAFDVVAIDRHGDDTPSAKALEKVGARHVNVAKGLDALGKDRYDFIVEASGSAPLDFDLLPLLGPNGVLVLTGIPSAEQPPFAIEGGALLRDLVLHNQVVLGSVNAHRRYFEEGLRALGDFERRWPGVAASLVTDRCPIEEYDAVFDGRREEAIKTVLRISG